MGANHSLHEDITTCKGPKGQTLKCNNKNSSTGAKNYGVHHKIGSSLRRSFGQVMPKSSKAKSSNSKRTISQIFPPDEPIGGIQRNDDLNYRHHLSGASNAYQMTRATRRPSDEFGFVPNEPNYVNMNHSISDIHKGTRELNQERKARNNITIANNNGGSSSSRDDSSLSSDVHNYTIYTNEMPTNDYFHSKDSNLAQKDGSFSPKFHELTRENHNNDSLVTLNNNTNYYNLQKYNRNSRGQIESPKANGQLHMSNGSVGSSTTSRSKRHPLSHQTPTPFHMSKAVNTKTSSVLSNNSQMMAVAMPKESNANIGVHEVATNERDSWAPTEQRTYQYQNLNLHSSYPLQLVAHPQIALRGHEAAHNKGASSLTIKQKPVDKLDGLNYASQDGENQQLPLYQTINSNQQHLATRNLQLDTSDENFQHQSQQYHQPQMTHRLKYPQQQHQYQYLSANLTDTNKFVQSPAPNFNALKQVQLNKSMNQMAANTNFDYVSPKSYNRNGFVPLANRSYSVGSSLTLDPKRNRKSHNPLASLFQASSYYNSPSDTSNLSKYSNTIHIGRKSEKSQPFAWSPAHNQRSCPGSLKRIKSTPLSAQQASYEAMRTIDMYMIRQIARSCMDFDMEQKIELEIRLRELAGQSILEARNEIDLLEVEKSLLTSDQRMNCYATQLEQQRKQLSNPSLSTDSGRGSKSGNSRNRCDVIGSCGNKMTPAANGASTSSPSFSSLSNSQSPSKLSPVSGESANSPSFTTNSSAHSRTGAYRYSTNTLSAKQKAKNKKRQQFVQSINSLSNINCNMVMENRATVSINDIRIPLMWRDVDHFKGRGDYKRYAIFCLLKIDSQIYDTQLISDVDRNVTDVTFDDLVAFNEIDHNFELNLEVYSCVYLEQYSISSTPRKLKEKLSSSVSRAMGRRLATQTVSSNYAKELQAYDKSYRFSLIASATLRLEDASDSIKTYDLDLTTPSAHHKYHQNTNSPNYQANRNSSSGNSLTLSNSKDAHKNSLPLFGHFCCRLHVRPDIFDKVFKTGYLRVASISIPNGRKADSSGNLTGSSPDSPTSNLHSPDASMRQKSHVSANMMGTLALSSSTVHWGLLRNFALHLWPLDEFRYESQILAGQQPIQLEKLRKPALSMRINRRARLLRVSNSSLTIEQDKGCFVLGAYCPEGGVLNQTDEMASWLRSIEQLIYDSHIWGSVLGHN